MNEEEARQRALRVHKWVQYLPSQNPGFQHAAGYASAQDYARMLRAGGIARFTDTVPSIDELRAKNIMFWGTPDQVYQQIEAFYRRVGGMGNLLTQMGGYATKHDTIDSMTLMAKEVLPRLQQLTPQTQVAA